MSHFRHVSFSASRRFNDALQRQNAFAPQLDLLSRRPHLVAFPRRLFVELDAELLLLDPPFAGSLAPHGRARDPAAALIEFSEVALIGEFVSDELGADLP